LLFINGNERKYDLRNIWIRYSWREEDRRREKEGINKTPKTLHFGLKLD